MMETCYTIYVLGKMMELVAQSTLVVASTLAGGRRRVDERVPACFLHQLARHDPPTFFGVHLNSRYIFFNYYPMHPKKPTTSCQHAVLF
jgi:hypothetical protein